VRLQRLFRAAFAGHLGAAFPVHKLVELTRDTRASVVEMRTPRWKAHPGLLEHYYLRTLYNSMFRNAGISEPTPARTNACLSLGDVKEGENPSLWPATSDGRARIAALANIGQPAWTGACVLPEKDRGGGLAAQNMQKLGDRIAKLRELRAALGIDAASDQKPLGPKGGGVCAPM